MIKGREGNRRSSSSSSSSSSAYSADLLVCFPSRTHLTLTPKPICSPSRPSETTTTNRRPPPHHRRQLSKLSAGSPVLWAKQASSKNLGNDEIAEPTSPKVTCAGQIKVRPSKCGGKGKNWQSVMEEIERIHVKNRKQSKFFGLKKDVLGFLTCMRNIRFDFRCFGDFRHADVTSDDDDDDEEEEEEEEEEETEEENSKTLFSKWFMVLQEEQSNNNDEKKKDEKRDLEENADSETAVPPPNALLLMRCRSAPAKSWLEETRMKEKTEHVVENREEETEEEEEETEEDSEMSAKKKKDLRSLMEEEKMELVLMSYDTEYYRLSSDIAKETWVVGGIQDPLSRSRSWKS